MKKQTFLPLLATVAMMWTGTAQAQTKYDLYIAGTQTKADAWEKERLARVREE